jgi:hypothetical protein
MNEDTFNMEIRKGNACCNYDAECIGNWLKSLH